MDFQTQEFEIKGSLKSVIGKLFLILFGFLFAFIVLVLLFKSCKLFECGIEQMLLLLTAVFVGYIFWINSYKIAFQNNKLLYKSIFAGETFIELSEIKRAEYQGFGSTYSERKTKLYPKILLHPLARGKEGSIEITLNVFSKDDLQKFYDLLESINKLPLKRNDSKK